jgi:hypothetical protein
MTPRDRLLAAVQECCEEDPERAAAELYAALIEVTALLVALAMDGAARDGADPARTREGFLRCLGQAIDRNWGG